jgi:hypothetical protein
MFHVVVPLFPHAGQAPVSKRWATTAGYFTESPAKTSLDDATHSCRTAVIGSIREAFLAGT